MVIAIIGMLAAGAISGYSAYRRAALLELSVDSLASQVYQARDDARRSAECSGLYFRVNGDRYDVSTFSQEFVGKKVWEEADWQYKGCDDDINSLRELDMSDLVNVRQVFVDGLLVNEFVLKFSPPEGELNFEKEKEAKIRIQYGEEKSDRYQKDILINLLSGNVEKNN